MFKLITHLLPNGPAWNVTIDKNLRRLFSGLSEFGSDIRTFADLVWYDQLPQTTRDIDGWEETFGLPDTGLTEQERRDRLDARWKALGGQDPEYIQETLQGAGFDVYVHEWWEPGTEPSVGNKACVTPRNPQVYLRREYTGVTFAVACGEDLAECGESFALCGNSLEPLGYPLVNKVDTTTPDITVLCSEEVSEAGEFDATCGNYLAFKEVPREYIVPNDPLKWPYFLYIGGETFPDLATVDSSRRDELEELCLKICPTQQWIGMLVTYS